MSLRRRDLLGMTAAGAAGVGLSLLGVGQASATARPLGAPTQRFAVGVRQHAWTRGSRKVTTYVYYPATGTPGGSPVTNAPVAQGVFPVCEFMHGYSSSPQKSLAIIRPLAEAGFVVPAPYFPNLNINDVYNGNQSKDVSEVITRTLALNTANDPLAGHINTTAGVGVSGHSMGGMTTHGLLTAWPDSRITAAIPMSCVDMGNPSSSVHAKVLFMHGDRDSTCPISSARQAYRELPAPKAFLTFKGASHSSYFGDSRTVKTFLDWMRWSLYADTAARDRLRSDATSSSTSWESAL
ncbi:twin-arginine translocation signal domain-containing protein [Streptomyces sp. Li-HN-5-11]|uniref:alpha/beta hydrolase family protein n=1 Tax=Streptomyces sp. Li-HN-5-11 TaxID=3075432 RepID=UPI0028A8C9FC|nr:twin-arginine translocation signal domain-containing protein [Streptomyces sp. Li-HN-5-11]WNM31923.1 twin-arginine translocation signal domain-containing protein [Streptomyces sp. Li-HN-5-11]